MTEAAFKACYSEWRMIKTRATVQLVFEIPIEQADAAYQALGGMPIAAKEVWCGIARLAQPASPRDPVPPTSSPPVGNKPGRSAQPTVPTEQIVRADKERRKWSELNYAQQAGIRCADPVFWAFLRETHRSNCNDEADATDFVRYACGVTSRKELKSDLASGLLWQSIDAAYDDWQALDRVSA